MHDGASSVPHPNRTSPNSSVFIDSLHESPVYEGSDDGASGPVVVSYSPVYWERKEDA